MSFSFFHLSEKAVTPASFFPSRAEINVGQCFRAQSGSSRGLYHTAPKHSSLEGDPALVGPLLWAQVASGLHSVYRLVCLSESSKWVPESFYPALAQLSDTLLFRELLSETLPC